MKLIIREYLASLRERDELDAMLPDLLTEMGYLVFSRPGRGTRQYGVDIAALSPKIGKERKLYLFSVKQGDLTRADWDGTSQALRASINQIRDVYIPTSVPTEYRNLKVVVCLVFGGDIKEAARLEVEQYLARETTPMFSFEEWNGDRLADLILSGLLREELLPDPMRSHLRKAVAMVEEPDISFSHFRSLVDGIVARPKNTQADQITKAREINICLWILFGWAREANTVEAPYRASEYAILRIWDILKPFLGSGRRIGISAGMIFNELVELHFTIWDTLAAKILPHVAHRHALSTAVGSFANLDVNLKLHELLGRMALRGLWLAWSQGRSTQLPSRIEKPNMALETIVQQLFQLIDNNPGLQSPVADQQAIDVTLALMLFAVHGGYQTVIASWVKSLVQRTRYAFFSHAAYPSCKNSYWDLVEHPTDKTDEYRKEATPGSILYPMLAMWAAGCGEFEALTLMSSFVEEGLGHCNMQLWFADSTTETFLYSGGEHHGDMLCNIPISSDGKETFEYVTAECHSNDHLSKLSAITLWHWPIVLMACRHHRIPVPPQMWTSLLKM